MPRSTGIPYRAIDVHERIVFFESIAKKKKNDVYIAKNTKGKKGYYRVRHRLNGPAMISKDETRRWFVHGIEKTLEVEKVLKSIESPFKKNTESELTEKAKKLLKSIFEETGGKIGSRA